MNPFAYDAGNGPLHRLSASSKAFCLILLSFAAMRFALLPLAILTAAGAALALSGRMDARNAITGLGPLAVLALAAALAKGLFPGGGRLFAVETLGDSAAYALRLLSVFLLARAYFVSTKASELGDAATRAWRVLKPAAPSRSEGGAVRVDPGILLGLSLVFLPCAFDRYRRVREAAAVRGYAPGRARPAALLDLLGTFVYANVRGALVTARAMELRGYDPERTLPATRFHAAGFLACLACAGVAALSFVA